ncbi:MAG: hypothetical protein V4696_13125 [Pseudomonadota bacterium]
MGTTHFGRILQSERATNVTAATLTVTNETHAGQVITLNRAGGITVTLPAAVGNGASYRFIVGTTFTSSGIIQVANASDTMCGNAVVFQDGGDTMVGFEAGATADTITLNGTTTGGLKGADIEVIDIATNLFWVNVRTAATGTEATPFSAAV